MIDGGLNDTSITDNDKMWLTKALQPILTVGIDTLILGCTHFPMLRGAIEEIAAPYGVKTVIDSARVGAEVLISELLKQK
jgi:glutamate racemase